MSPRPKLEDKILDALTLLHHTTNSYNDELAESLAEGLRRGTVLPLTMIYLTGPARISTIAESLGLDRTTITRHFDELEQLGLVRRDADETDRRAVLASLTPKAWERFDAFRSQDRARVRKVIADWTPEERRTFATLLHRFAEMSLSWQGDQRA